MLKPNKDKTKRLPNRKLRRTILFWFLLISVIPLCLVCFISFNIAYNTLKDHASNSLINAAKLKKEFLESYFSERVADLDFQSQEMANIKFLRKLKKSFLKSGLSIEKYVKSYEHSKLSVRFGDDLKNFQASYGYIDILLLDDTGHFLFSITGHNRHFMGTNMFTGKYADSNISKACKKSMNTGKPYLSDYEFCKSNANEIDFFIVQAVVDSEGRKIGLIALQIPVYSIDKLMRDRTGLGDTGETYLIGSDLLMRTSSRFSENSTVLNLKVNTKRTNEWLINKTKLGHLDYQNTGIKTSSHVNQNINMNKPETYKAFKANIYKDYRGINVLGLGINIDMLDRLGVHWILIAEIDENEAFRSAYILRNIILTMIFLTVVFVVVISLTISKLIVNPIIQLANLLPQFAKGNMDIDFKIKSQNEIGFLEESFKNMAVDLRNTTVSIDYLKNIFESMYDVLVVLTPDFKIKTANKQFCNLLDYPLDYITGKLFDDFFTKSNLLTEMELNKLNKDGFIYDLEKIFFSNYFVKIPALLSVSKMHDKEGICQGIVCVAKDITERKHYDEDREKFVEELGSKQIEIERTNKNLKKTLEALHESQTVILQQEKLASLGQLAAGVAHEINNPIGFVSSNINTLGKYTSKFTEFIALQDAAINLIDNKDVVANVNKNRKKLKMDFILDDIDSLIKESLEGAERVKKIVLDLKNFARHGDEEAEMANINGCIRSSLNIVWNELKYKASINKNFGDIPLTKCYPLLLGQVFMNILINSAHAIKEHGDITIKTWQEEKSIYVSILDTGCGISKENINKVFDPFFTTKDVGEGTGLGMSISYDIIKKHNGSIKVESETGKWSRFIVKIPVIDKL